MVHDVAGDGQQSPAAPTPTAVPETTASPTPEFGTDDEEETPTLEEHVELEEPGQDGVTEIPESVDARKFARGYLASLLSFDATSATYLEFWQQQADAWAAVPATSKPLTAFDTAMAQLGYTEGQWTRWRAEGRERRVVIVRELWDEDNVDFKPVGEGTHLLDAYLEVTDTFEGRTSTVERDIRVVIACPGSELPGAGAVKQCELYAFEVRL